jgi:hypothetical protein
MKKYKVWRYASTTLDLGTRWMSGTSGSEVPKEHAIGTEHN